MRHLRGFTLLELVVVVVIIAITVAMLAPQLSVSGRWRDLQREADSLAARVRVAQDMAMLESREYGVVFEDTGYRFVFWDRQARRFIPVQDPSAKWAVRQFDEGITMTVGSDASEPVLVIPEAGEERNEAAAAATAGDKEPEYSPSVFVLSSGEVTPFTAVFRAEGEEREIELGIDPLGDRIDDREGADVPAS